MDIEKLVATGTKIHLPNYADSENEQRMAAMLLPLIWDRNIKVGINFRCSNPEHAVLGNDCDVEIHFFDNNVKEYKGATEAKDVLKNTYKEETANKGLTGYVGLPIFEEENKIFVLAKTRIVTIEMAARTFSAVVKLKAFQKAFEEKPVTKEEMEYFRALSVNNRDVIDKVLKEFVERPDIKRALISNMFKGTLDFNLNGDLDRLKHNIKECYERIQDYDRRIVGLFENIRDYEKDVNDILVEKQNGEAKLKDIVDFVTQTPGIEIVGNTGDKTIVQFYTDLDMVDHDLIKTMVNDEDSLLYNGVYQPSGNMEVVREFWKRIFVDNEYKVQTVSEWQMNANSNISPVSGNRDFFEKNIRMPNPHLRHYTCAEQTLSQIRNNAPKRLFINNLMLAYNATKIMSFGDSTVTEKLANDLFEGDKKILRDKNGNLISARELVKIIEEEIGE